MKTLSAFFILLAALLLPSAYAEASTGLVSISQEVSSADGLRIKRELDGNVLTESECRVISSALGTSSACTSQRVVLSKREAGRVRAAMVATSQALTLPMGLSLNETPATKAQRRAAAWKTVVTYQDRGISSRGISTQPLTISGAMPLESAGPSKY